LKNREGSRRKHRKKDRAWGFINMKGAKLNFKITGAFPSTARGEKGAEV